MTILKLNKLVIVAIYFFLLISIFVFIPKIYARSIERKANALIEQETSALNLGTFSQPNARCGDGGRRSNTGNYFGFNCVNTKSNGQAASIAAAQAALSAHGWKTTYDRGNYLPKDGMPRLLLYSLDDLCAEVINRNNNDKTEISVELRHICS